MLLVLLILQSWGGYSENRAAALKSVVLFGLLTVGDGALFEATAWWRCSSPRSHWR